MARSSPRRPLAWLDPQLLDQRPASVLVDLQRIRLALAAVEREHQLRRAAARGTGARPSAASARRPPQRACQRPARPPPAARGPPPAGPRAAQSRLARTPRRRSRRAATRAIATTPRAARPPHAPAPAPGKRMPSLFQEALEAFCVELAGAHAQLVAGWPSGQNIRVAKRLAQPRDVDLHRLARVDRGVFAPKGEASRSQLTGSLGCKSNTASTARVFGPPNASAPRSLCTSSGPRTRNSIVLGDRTGPRPGLKAPVSALQAHRKRQLAWWST